MENWNTKIQKGLEKIGLCRNKTYLCGVKINIKSKRLYIMYLTSEKKEELFSQYGKSNKDTGSVESQVALFSYRIAHLTEHLRKTTKISLLKDLWLNWLENVERCLITWRREISIDIVLSLKHWIYVNNYIKTTRVVRVVLLLILPSSSFYLKRIPLKCLVF